MTSGIDVWLRDSMDLVAEFQFSSRGTATLRAARIELVPVTTIADGRGPCIAIPRDLAAPARPLAPWSVPFGATQLRLWNPIPRPGERWAGIPASAPLWWRHESGTLTPAWNLWANIRDTLLFRDERENESRDAHGRFPAEASTRRTAGLLDVPATNDANAALLDAAIGLAKGQPPLLRLEAGLVRPPWLALSHDCDQLRGDDRITQAVRLYRAVGAFATGRVGRSWRHLRAIGSNVVRPKAFFEQDLESMLDLERRFGFTSVSYFLTGRGGRFGARSGTAIAQRVAAALPRGWEAGVHYNYWTVGDGTALRREMETVAAVTASPVIAGRAHYLRFNPLTDPAFLETNGIRVDESIGWANHLSYRAGIAGPFYPFDQTRNRVVSVLELPMMCMDAALAAPGGEQQFERMWKHLTVVGGMLSVLFHPGAFRNPEFSEFDGLYERILSRVSSAGATSQTPTQLTSAVANWRPRRSAPAATIP